MAEALMVKGLGGGFEPLNDSDRDALKGVPVGEIVRVNWSRPRNPKFHRLFFALLNIVYANQEYYKSFEHMRAAITVAVGHTDKLKSKDGGIIYLPKSISFAKMDEDQFYAFFNRVLDLIIRDILPNTDREELIRAVYDIARIPYGGEYGG